MVEKPKGEWAIWGFLEMIALAWVFAFVEELVKGDYYQSIGCFMAALLFFVIGVEWSSWLYCKWQAWVAWALPRKGKIATAVAIVSAVLVISTLFEHRPTAPILLRDYRSDIALLELENATGESFYILSLETKMDDFPGATNSVVLGFDLPSHGHAKFGAENKSNVDITTIPPLGATWEEHYRAASALFRDCLLVMVMPRDSVHIKQLKNYYSTKDGSVLRTADVEGILSYEVSGTTEVLSEPVALVAVLFYKSSGCTPSPQVQQSPPAPAHDPIPPPPIAGAWAGDSMHPTDY